MVTTHVIKQITNYRWAFIRKPFVFTFQHMYRSKVLILILLFLSFSGKAQSFRDVFIKDSILPILNSNAPLAQANYDKLKKNIAFIERRYGFETGLKRRLIEQSYLMNDIDFFKKQITILIREFGFNVGYMSENESYYNSIMQGDLSKWFKKTYLKNHTFWLKNNFEKQIDLRKINELNAIDKVLASTYVEVMSTPNLDSLQQSKIKHNFNKSYFQNILEIHKISEKNKFLPNEKRYAVIQNSYNNVIIHNLIENLDATWNLLFPYFKKAYINNEIDNVIFQNYDFYCYLKHGYIEFNSYSLEQIPENFRRNEKVIQLKDEQEYQKIKNEFKWY